MSIFELKWAIYGPKIISKISEIIFIWTAAKNCSQYMQYHPFLTTLFYEAPCIYRTKITVGNSYSHNDTDIPRYIFSLLKLNSKYWPPSWYTFSHFGGACNFPPFIFLTNIRQIFGAEKKRLHYFFKKYFFWYTSEFRFRFFRKFLAKKKLILRTLWLKMQNKF